jgi:single-stranded-DNA-specific exonuclease
MAEKNAFQLGTGDLTPIGAAFYIVPLVNSITRVGTQEEKRLVFESMLDWKADMIVPSTKRGHKGEEETLLEQALRTCTNVKNRQTKVRDSSTLEIEEVIAEDGLLSHKLLLIRLRDREVDPAVRGLIANELMSKYKRPVAILSPRETAEGLVWSGSSRGYEKSQLKDFRKFCLGSPFDIEMQGHANACGMTIKDQDFNDFVKWSDEALKNVEFSPSYMVDFIYHGSTFKTKDILELGDAKSLWGQSIDEPLIAVENIAVTKDMVTLMSRDKNPTLKIQLSNGVACIKFKSSEEELEALTSNELGCVNLNLVARPEVNRYYGSVTPQLLIQEYEIVSRQNYYF